MRYEFIQCRRLYVYSRVNCEQWKKVQKSFHAVSLKVDAAVQACHTSLAVVPSSVGLNQVGIVYVYVHTCYTIPVAGFTHRMSLVHVYRHTRILVLSVVAGMQNDDNYDDYSCSVILDTQQP